MDYKQKIMNKFKSVLIVQVPFNGGDRELYSPLKYYSDLVKKEILVPTGFITDYGSIPKILHNVLSPTGKPTYGFVIHDYLYKEGMFSKNVSDDILDESMIILGVGWFKRKTIMAGLKVGGFVAWNKHRKKDNK